MNELINILQSIGLIFIAIAVFIIIFVLHKKEDKMDNKKKKKQDGKRIALGQKHERDYLKKIAKKQLEQLKKQKGRVIWGTYKTLKKNKCSKANLIRITKALIKYLERK